MTWIYWGYWKENMIFTSPWLGFGKTTAAKGLSISGEFLLPAGHFFYKQEDFNIIKKKFKESLEDPEHEWLNKFFALCEQQMKELAEQETVVAFLRYLDDYLGCCCMVELLDFCIEGELEDIDQELLTKLLTPSRPTYLMKFSQQKKKDPAFVKEWAWVGYHGFEGKPLSIEDITEEQSPKQEQVECPEKYQDIISIARKLIFYRSQLMEHFNKESYKFIPILKKEAAEAGLEYGNLLEFTHLELIDFIEKGVIPDFQGRGTEFGLEEQDGNILIYTPEEAQKILEKYLPKEEVKEVSGRIAWKGKLQGTAKIILDDHDFHKLEEGDILIASETQPDFIIIMQKAAAFVTDNGGITSHAALVAREMQKPCITGTKNATKVFKDGDRVEVDAENGVVRKL